jgi:hypothetical protein
LPEPDGRWGLAEEFPRKIKTQKNNPPILSSQIEENGRMAAYSLDAGMKNQQNINNLPQYFSIDLVL